MHDELKMLKLQSQWLKNGYVNMFHSHYKDDLKRKEEERSKEEEEAQKRLAAQKIKDLRAKKARLRLSHEQDVREIDSVLKILSRKP